MDTSTRLSLAILITSVGTLAVFGYLWLTADAVTCDAWGNCVFTTTLKNSTRSLECYENGRPINCSAFDAWAERTGYQEAP